MNGNLLLFALEVCWKDKNQRSGQTRSHIHKRMKLALEY